MSIFICEKCGKLDNTACDNNYYHATINRYKRERGESLDISFMDNQSYFEDHACCSDCCNGLLFKDGSGGYHNRDSLKDKKHWSEFGKQKLLEWEERRDGSMVNAEYYFKTHPEF